MRHQRIRPRIRQANVRMPDTILKGIDGLAGENLHDRSAEINSACRYWIEIGGKTVTCKTTLERIGFLEIKVESLEEEIQNTLAEMKFERELLLKIIENHEHTIKKLLNTLPSSESGHPPDTTNSITLYSSKELDMEHLELYPKY